MYNDNILPGEAEDLVQGRIATYDQVRLGCTDERHEIALHGNIFAIRLNDSVLNIDLHWCSYIMMRLISF